MRISFFVPRCTGDNSHGRYVIELARRFGDAHSVTVYSRAFWPPLRHHARCRYVPVPNRPAIARLAGLWVASVAAVLRRPADIVHIQGADAPVGNVVTAHCCNGAMRAADQPHLGRIRRWNYAIGAAAERYCFSKPSTRRVIAVSQKVKKDVEHYYGISPERIVVIPHGVDAETFHARNRDRHREVVRQQLRVGVDEFVVVFVGRDYRLKGLPVLVEAVRRAGVRITIIAVGVAPNAIPEEIRGTEGVVGRVLSVGLAADVVPYYAAADCYVLPTRYDTFSLATLEAMASGLPVIVSRAAGITEHLRHGVDALVLEEPHDVSALAEYLLRLASDHALAAQLRCAGRETAERFSWERVAERTLEVYGLLLSAPR